MRATLKTADFQRALAVRPCARSEHFVLHHLPVVTAATADLSTDQDPQGPTPVDETLRFGLVVPKRHARRSVTRNLVKRQGREACARHAEHMSPGDWLLRLRSPFVVSLFPSAASASLAGAVRTELESLFASAATTAR